MFCSGLLRLRPCECHLLIQHILLFCLVEDAYGDRHDDYHRDDEPKRSRPTVELGEPVCVLFLEAGGYRCDGGGSNSTTNLTCGVVQRTDDASHPRWSGSENGNANKVDTNQPQNPERRATQGRLTSSERM